MDEGPRIITSTDIATWPASSGRLGSVRGRADGAVLGRGGALGRLHPAHRAGRLLFSAQGRAAAPKWTWFTFPLLVLVAGGVACTAAYWLKGGAAHANQIDLVDVDAAAGSRGTSWMNVFCSRAEAFDFAARPGGLLAAASGRAAGLAVAWLGLPGKGLGGMDPQTSESIAWSGRYEFSPALGRHARPADSHVGNAQSHGPLERDGGRR